MKRAKGHDSVKGYRTNKRFCPHCEENLMLKTYKLHKRLYYNKVGSDHHYKCYIVKALKWEIVRGRLEIVLSKLCSTTCYPAGLISANLHIICLVAHL